MFEFLELHFSLLLIAAGKAKTFDANEKRLHYFFKRTDWSAGLISKPTDR